MNNDLRTRDPYKILDILLNILFFLTSNKNYSLYHNP